MTWKYTRPEAAHLSGFVQQLVRLISLGYRYYVVATVPPGKAPEAVDRKIIERYGLDVSKWARARRKRAGKANLQYLRYKEQFILIATPGEHVFFRREGRSIKDVREHAIHVGGYEVKSVLCSDGKWHVSVRIAPDQYRRLRAYIEERAPRRSIASLSRELRALPFEPWGPVKTQFRALRNVANRARRKAGLKGEVPLSSLRLSRKSVRPFQSSAGAREEAP